MTIAQDILDSSRGLIDELNVGGVKIPSTDSDMQALEYNGISYINQALREVYRESKSFQTLEVSNKRIPNLLGDLGQFNKIDFIGTDQVYPENGLGVVGAKAYYVEPDADYTIYIEEFNGSAWVILTTLTAVTSVPVRLKGLITPSDDSYPIQMRMSGTTFYRHENRCLYSYPFKSDAIPEYRPWIPITMPSDFGELDEIIDEHPVRQYSQDGNYKWEGFDKLYINYFYEGTLRVIYNPTPTIVTLGTDTVILPNPIALEFCNNFVAARMATTENPQLVNYFEQKANELMFKANKTGPSSEEAITDVYFGGNYG